MKIVIFGASGRTGQHVLEQALEAGYEVTILVRDPSKIKIQNAKLKILVGDVQNSSQVLEALTGAQAVISVLGSTQNKPVFEISKGMVNIISAMKNLGVHRLIASIGAGVGDPKDAPRLFNYFMNILLRIISRYIYEDMLRVATIIRASDLDWTMVRVPMLTDDPRTGIIKVGYVGKGMGPRISRADMAEFILQQLTDNTYLRQAPAISN